MFPQAPIIHMLRHPLDVMLSVFSNQLTHGYFSAAELETITKHYALTMGLVAHYRAYLDPILPILEPFIERLGYTVK
jgi:hypothetical protein